MLTRRGGPLGKGGRGKLRTLYIELCGCYILTLGNSQIILASSIFRKYYFQGSIGCFQGSFGCFQVDFLTVSFCSFYVLILGKMEIMLGSSIFSKCCFQGSCFQGLSKGQNIAATKK